MTGRVKIQYLSANLPVLGKLCAVFLAVLLRSQTAECFQFFGAPFELAVLPQDFQLHLQVLDLRFHVVQLGENSSAVGVFRYSRLFYLIRLNTVLGYHILCKGVTLVSHKENIDTDTPAGKFMLTVFAALSQLEREQLRLLSQRLGNNPDRIELAVKFRVTSEDAKAFKAKTNGVLHTKVWEDIDVEVRLS